MQKISFNKEWKCYVTGKPQEAFIVDVPHDAMLLDEKSENSPAGVNTGWYMAQDYTYEKEFTAPEEWEEKRILFEFEGVYRKATVYLNGTKIAYQDYGYSGFYADAGEWLLYGMKNVLKVTVKNHDQPNSRWYSGTGIYRPVWINIMPKSHIIPGSVRIKTLDYQNPTIQINAQLENRKDDLTAKIEIFEITDERAVILENEVPKTGKRVTIKEVTPEMLASGVLEETFVLPEVFLWSPNNPIQYLCRITYGKDVVNECFGIRMIESNPSVGFRINGKREILLGACIHHDNGILGACAYDFSEYRKVKILKDAGYNAIRSAHNPCSKALLRACDKLGMLVMDEYTDMWYIHKTKYDYAAEVEKNYRVDLKRLVEKDYNHPSVIMYSTGNEVAESAQKRGIALCGRMTEYLHQLDDTRPVSCGINIFFNFLSRMGFGIYSDEKADQAAKDATKKKAVGSEFFNTVAGIMGAGFMKFGATLYPCDLLTRDAFSNMDIAGYNYGINRYKHDLKKYPNRLILGSETFCADAYRFYEEAKQNERVIGDFVWAGMDYLGEAGIGAHEYKEYAPRFDLGLGWVSAGSGRIDLSGKILAEMKYTQVAFEQREIALAVLPVAYANQKHSPSAWKMTNAIESWSWHGCEGMKTKAEIYARGAKAALFLNGKKVGEKPLKNDCKVVIPITYEEGELVAVSYNENGEELSRTSLKTARNETVLSIEPEMECIAADRDLCYVRFRYTDSKGELQPMARADICLEVENGKLLGFGSACPYYTKNYQGNVSDTYYGETIAVIQPKETGTIIIKASGMYGEKTCEIEVV